MGAFRTVVRIYGNTPGTPRRHTVYGTATGMLFVLMTVRWVHLSEHSFVTVPLRIVGHSSTMQSRHDGTVDEPRGSVYLQLSASCVAGGPSIVQPGRAHLVLIRCPTVWLTAASTAAPAGPGPLVLAILPAVLSSASSRRSRARSTRPCTHGGPAPQRMAPHPHTASGSLLQFGVLVCVIVPYVLTWDSARPAVSRRVRTS